jgi:putative DNA primase/helicase
MVGFGRREHTQIIAAITTRADPYRAAYARVSEDHPRTTIFAATSETDRYLDDDRGKRRYWPLRCTEIRLDVLTSTRDQLFAEATVEFKKGSTWHIVPSEEAEQEQLERRIPDPWEDQIADYVIGKIEVTTSEVITDALQLPPSQQDRAAQMRVSKVLKTLGFECRVVREGHRILRRYSRKV